MPLHTVVYVSAASPGLAPRKLADFVSQVSEQCTREKVTGLLLYRDGNFAGALEGEVEPVMRVYRTVREDARHVHFMVVLSVATSAREFDSWSVAEHLDAVKPDGNAGLGLTLLAAMWGRQR